MLAAALAGCGQPAASPRTATGVVLLDLGDGHEVARVAAGSDPVAVVVSADGATAYVSDNQPGLVRAIELSSRRVTWTATVGGRPGPLLLSGGRLWVSLYGTGSLASLDPGSGRLLETRPVCPSPGQLVEWRGQVWTLCGGGAAASAAGASLPAPAGFGLAAGPGGLWAAGYDSGEVQRLDAPGRAAPPSGQHPFWLSMTGDGSLLVAAEASDEDRGSGSVSLLEAGGAVRVLAGPRDPDQAVESAGVVYVAAHGDRRVLVLRAGSPEIAWAPGLDPVALAVDPALKLLVVVSDERE